jgi:hypothetical protein
VGLSVHQVYLATGFTDMRKSINGLSLIVSEQLGQDPFAGSVFVFCNRSRDCVILVLVHIASHFEMKSLVCTYFRRLRMCGLIDAYVYKVCGGCIPYINMYWLKVVSIIFYTLQLLSLSVF